MPTCPVCQQHDATRQRNSGLELDYCPACQLIWFDSGSQGPGFYRQLERQVSLWEQGLAQRLIEV